MNKRLESCLRTGILFAWPLTWSGVALAQSVPGSGMSAPDVSSSGNVGASPSGSTSNSSEMGTSPQQNELNRSHLPPDSRIPPGTPTPGSPRATPPAPQRPPPGPPVNPGDLLPLPGSPRLTPPDTLYPPAIPTSPPSVNPPTPGAPRPGTANQTQETPLPPDVVPRDAAAGQVRDVTPRPSSVNTGAHRRSQPSTSPSKKGRRVRHPKTRPGSTLSEPPGKIGRTELG
jgi:hypothetical protein